jgi:hypothetical protein
LLTCYALHRLPDVVDDTVNKYFKKRFRSVQRSLALTALALCVFMWGLGYKLSLYAPPQASSHPIPIAKLLSKNDSAGLEDTLQRLSKGVVTAPVIAALVCGIYLLCGLGFDVRARLGSVQWAGNRGRVGRRLHNASFNAFFFRPPPFTIS